MPPRKLRSCLPRLPELLPVFQELLPSAVLAALIKDSGRSFYQRLFTPLVVVWGFLYQRLHPDHSLAAVVSYLASGAADDLGAPDKPALSARLQSANTSGYCQARQRLPGQVLHAGIHHTAQRTRTLLGEAGCWQGHLVHLLDGTTLRLRPSAALLAHYGQPRNQHGPAYWVVMRVVVTFCLLSGVVVQVAEGAYRTSEQALAAQLFAQALANSVYGGDRAFGIFSVAQAARHAHCWVVLRLTRVQARYLAQRALDWGWDLPLQWSPSGRDQCHAAMARTPIAGRLITVRLERPGFRPVEVCLFTTLTDPVRYPAADLIALYSRRWQAELNLRYLKSTLQLDTLASRSVALAQKELWAGLLAYNLVRAFMVKATHALPHPAAALSFTQVWRAVRDFIFYHRTAARLTAEQFCQWLARCALPTHPPHRQEPRKIRRRPAVYPNLKGTRAEARQSLHIPPQTAPANS